MKAIMVMFDSLRRDFLPCYGEELLNMPNFKRLADHAAVFDNSYVSSMPCMPARRELHTGRANFLHRSWGPLEPFDDSMPAILTAAGIRTHLATDHFHYLQDGGGTYHSRYQTWECYRGQENDAWIPESEPHPTEFAPCILGGERLEGTLRNMRARGGWQNAANRRARSDGEKDYAQTLTFDNGLGFIEGNVGKDNWFLQIETFDPHEPFDAPESFERNWFDPDQPFTADWPPYAPVQETADVVNNVRKKYFASMDFCDKNLGRVMDAMDKYDLWKDTMLIVNTDHGFFLGEHDWWGKGPMPDYQELVHTPFFIWDPRSGICGEHRRSLVQTIDIAPTLMEFFGVEIPKDMIGKALVNTVARDEPVREYGIMGYFGGTINITDGRYMLMKAVTHPENPCYEYTQMPAHMNRMFSAEEMRSMEIAPPFGFTKGTKLMKIVPDRIMFERKLRKDLLFDLETDRNQKATMNDEEISARMEKALLEMMKEYEAPEELYGRYDFKNS